MAVRELDADLEIDLTEDEAYALLLMCLLTPMKLDATSELALRKLAEFCKSRHYYVHNGSAETHRT